jgi:hypothetical protein
MTRVVLLWILGSAVVAMLGRRKSVGFWGFLLFSLIFSPVVGALSLLVAGPSAAQRRRETEARALMLVAAGHRPATPPPGGAPVRRATESSAAIRSIRSAPQDLLGILPRAALRAFAFGWLVTILVFSAAYWVLGTRTAGAIPSATALSLEVATFGFSPGASLGAYVNTARLPALYPPPVSGTASAPAAAVATTPPVIDSVNVTEAVTRQSEQIAAVRKEIEGLPLAYSQASTALIDRVAALFSPPPMLRLLMGIQRAVVVILLIILIARLAESRYETLAREMVATAEQHRSGISALEESLREIATLSRRSLETMRALEAERMARAAAEQTAPDQKGPAQKEKDALVMGHATT